MYNVNFPAGHATFRAALKHGIRNPETKRNHGNGNGNGNGIRNRNGNGIRNQISMIEN